jgi:hypothetical protein
VVQVNIDYYQHFDCQCSLYLFICAFGFFLLPVAYDHVLSSNGTVGFLNRKQKIKKIKNKKHFKIKSKNNKLQKCFKIFQNNPKFTKSKKKSKKSKKIQRSAAAPPKKTIGSRKI